MKKSTKITALSLAFVPLLVFAGQTYQITYSSSTTGVTGSFSTVTGGQSFTAKLSDGSVYENISAAGATSLIQTNGMTGGHYTEGG